MSDLRPYAILPVAALLATAACTQTTPQGSIGGNPAPRGPESAVVASAPAGISSNIVRSETTSRIELPTPEGRRLVLTRTSSERIGEAGIVWHGIVAGEPSGTAIIVENKGAVAGAIFTPTADYQLRGTGPNVVISRIDQSRFPPEAEPIPRPGLRDNRADPALDTCTTDSGDNIDVMVLYTDDARVAAGSTSAMEAEAYLAVAVSNQAYINSNITQRLRLVHTAEQNYAETGVSSTDLSWLSGNSAIQSLRNTFAADDVVLLTNTLDACGRGYIMTSVGNAFESSAYAVVERTCASSNFSFPHELGHNMGARHDWDTDSTDNSPYHDNHGFRISGTWRTIMAYNCTTNCPRIQYFSNPAVSVSGTATGTSAEPNPTDNAQTLNLTAQTVANFRCSSPGRLDVWMKDRWNDTGVEPDPLTAGQPMWESPYIWVRNSQDTQLIHQHEHQNPEFGSPNWAYVKLHNGGPSASGTLHLYAAPASSGLAWPTSFTEIGAVPVTIAANSTNVVEVPWPSLPGTGHYCLVARWDSPSDPMHSEGADINANTIANNNIIWRNVNIVDLSADADQSFSFTVRNPSREQAVLANVRIVLPRNANKLSFADVGEIVLQMNPRLLEAGRDLALRGIRRDGDRMLVAPGSDVAEIGGLVLRPGAEGQVKVNVRRPPTAYPRDVFRIRIEQWLVGENNRSGAAPNRLLGGVTYDVSTGKRQTYLAPRNP